MASGSAAGLYSNNAVAADAAYFNNQASGSVQQDNYAFGSGSMAAYNSYKVVASTQVKEYNYLLGVGSLQAASNAVVTYNNFVNPSIDTPTDTPTYTPTYTPTDSPYTPTYTLTDSPYIPF